MPNTIADNLSRLVTAKTNIANAIIEMGGTVNDGDGFEAFPADIATIPAATFEVCELIKSSGLGGEVYGINTEDRTIVAGLLYKTGSYSSIVLTFPQGFTPRYTKSVFASVYYDYGYVSPKDTSANITNSSITLDLRGFSYSGQTKQVPICIQFGTN